MPGCLLPFVCIVHGIIYRCSQIPLCIQGRPEVATSVKVFEVDFQAVTSRKAQTINATPVLARFLQNVEEFDTGTLEMQKQAKGRAYSCAP